MAKSLQLTSFHESIARMGEFMGYRVPLQYTSISEEHISTRLSVTICDASHMGMYVINDVEKLDQFSIRPLKNLDKGRAMYSVIIDEDGRIVDDGIFLHLDLFYFVGNAATRESFPRFLTSRQISFEPYESVKLAVQGPKSPELLAELKIPTPYPRNSCACFNINGYEVIVSQTGYTGELGFEIFSKNVDYASNIVRKARNLGIRLCGLAARDTLRLEVGLPLFGLEYTDEHSPLESGMSKLINIDHRRVAWSRMRDDSQLIFFETLEFLGVPRTGYDILDRKHRMVGKVTSGNKTPFLPTPVGFARIRGKTIDSLEGLSVKIRDQLCPIRAISKDTVRMKVKQAVFEKFRENSL